MNRIPDNPLQAPLAVTLSNKELFMLLDSLDAYRRQSFRQELPLDYMARIDGLINKVQGMIGAAARYDLGPAASPA